MRPTKYMTDCVSMLREALDSGITSQCLTDKEAFFKMNDMLSAHGQRICYRTYQRYKAAAIAFGEETVEEQETFDPMFQLLYHTIQRSQIEQKENLYQALMDAEGHEWHKYKWIMERKFPDFNLRVVTERYLRESEMIEKRMMELDMEEMGIGPSPKPDKERPKTMEQPTMQKPEEQLHYEMHARQEAQNAVPREEQAAFSLYWDNVQHEWDKKNPVTIGYIFSEAVMKKLLWHYQVEFALWEKDKKKWMKNMAA